MWRVEVFVDGFVELLFELLALVEFGVASGLEVGLLRVSHGLGQFNDFVLVSLCLLFEVLLTFEALAWAEISKV